MTTASAQDPDLPHPRRGRRGVRLGFVLTAIVGAPVALLLSWPQAVSAERLPGIAQLISFRAGLAIALLVAGLVFAALARAHRRWSVAAALAVLLVAASAANAGVVLARGGGGVPTASAGPDELTVVAWNTLGGAASPQSIARLVIETDADIVSLPETDETAVAEVARLVALEGKAMTADTTRGADDDSDIPTSVLIADELGDYRMDEDAGSTPGLPSGVWEPVDGSGPHIVAAHPLPPLPGMFDDWRGGLEWVADRCTDPEAVIVGDLNATVDHLGAALDGCRDAALETGAATDGTWPAAAPLWLAAPIDHVLVGSAWEVRGATVITDAAGSDHRPIVAVISPVPR
ncbi:endonuclease/exonuclease/phosphatase family protein [Microbacterium sp. EST19A]|uniref:endonuclease/exonuclease/phosphatase family protein n=1 Tax=Microbacterium sp. EST19A TaxID=2862681 RepID=UPI001CBE0E29|nr:endonuclease/exonuclease/phosphatase family protein [Microbacterium sp. EST19A]